jgi:hypothetical protein
MPEKLPQSFSSRIFAETVLLPKSPSVDQNQCQIKTSDLGKKET